MKIDLKFSLAECNRIYSSRVSGGIGPMKLRQPFEGYFKNGANSCGVIRKMGE